MIDKYAYKKENSGLYALEITGWGCASCEAVLPEIKEALTNFPEVKFLRLDENEDFDEIKSLKIEKVPCLALMNNGVEFGRVYGFQPSEILEVWLENKLQEISEK